MLLMISLKKVVIDEVSLLVMDFWLTFLLHIERLVQEWVIIRVLQYWSKLGMQSICDSVKLFMCDST